MVAPDYSITWREYHGEPFSLVELPPNVPHLASTAEIGMICNAQVGFHLALGLRILNVVNALIIELHRVPQRLSLSLDVVFFIFDVIIDDLIIGFSSCRFKLYP